MEKIVRGGVQDGWERKPIYRELDRSLAPGNRQVMILVFDGFSLMHAGRLAEVFSEASQHYSSLSAPASGYDLSLVSTNGGAVQSSSGVPVWTEALERRRVRRLDALFVLAGVVPEKIEHDDRLFAWLRHVYPLTSVVQGVKAGGSILEAAGLRFKGSGDAHIKSLSITCENDGTPKDVQSGLDDEGAFSAALVVVHRDLGYRAAHDVARRLTSICEQRMPESVFDSREIRASERIRNCAHWLRVNCEHPISTADAAHLAAMSERTLLRHFKRELGVTPSEFVLRVRLEKASAMLVDTNLPADKIARHSGIGNGGRLAKLFRQHLSTSPTEYRLSRRRQMCAENRS